VKQAVREVETELDRIGSKAVTPRTSGYRPEMDVTPELDAARMRYYQELIGVLRWICELGRIDILCSVAMLSHRLAMPREWYLDQCFQMFGYLKRHDRWMMVFDETEPNIDPSWFTKCDCAELYPYAKEATPPNAPEVRGRAVTTHCFVDAATKAAVELVEALRHKGDSDWWSDESVLRQRSSGRERDGTGIMFEEEARFDCASLHSRADCCWND
jgi:hypothetical protein